MKKLISQDKIDTAADQYASALYNSFDDIRGYSVAETGFQNGCEFVEKEFEQFAVDFADFLKDIVIDVNPFGDNKWVCIDGTDKSSKELFDEFINSDSL